MIFPRLLLGIAATLTLAAGGALAEDDSPARVGRVSAVVGAVDYRPHGADWSSALVNEPVTEGTGLRSDAASRGAIAAGEARVSLAPASELRVTALTSDWLQVAVERGRVGVHLGVLGPGQIVEIDLRRGGVWLAAPGDYDIDTGGDHAPARVVVHSGAATVAGEGMRAEVAAGSVAMLHGAGAPEIAASAAVADGFTDWWRNRDDKPVTHPLLAAAVTGIDELDRHGEWKTDPKYGEVWFPGGLLDDWMPFRFGRWRLVALAGWTWIDDAPWGFAPAHYGGWTRIGKRWAWVPPKGDGPAYSPARVGFLGTAGIGLSTAVGSAVGWLPLAPGEQPDETFDDDFRNRRVATVIPRAAFVGGRPVLPELLELPAWRLRDAPVIDGALTFAPRAKPAAAVPIVSIAPARKPEPRRATMVASRAAHVPAAAKASRKPLPHPRVAASTPPPNPPHNRQHVAANR